MEQKTLSRDTLIPKDKELLEKTLAKDPAEMTKVDKGIVRARRAYLTAIERDVFAEILEEKAEELENEDAAIEEEGEEKPKKGRGRGK